MRRQFIGALLLAAAIAAVDGKSPDPLTYTIRFPDPASKSFAVDVSVPTERRESVDLMMPVWSPGFYGLQNYAQRVSDVTATAADGTVLPIATPTTSRWTVAAGGRPAFTLTYTVAAPRPSNLGNGVTETGAVIIGPATYITLVDPPRTHRPAQVRLELPSSWNGSMTSLDAATDHQPNHYEAPDYDTLADSPILAGAELTTTPFTVDRVQHYWTYLGHAEWQGEKAVAMLTPLIDEHVRFWGRLPYRKYVFLNIVTGGGGGSGVEHLNSVAITTGGRAHNVRGPLPRGRVSQSRVLPRDECEAAASD